MTEAISLIGLSGTGKTTVGTLLATLLGWRFVDTDAMIEAEAGVPVGEIFAREGEATFRRLESAALARAVRQPRAIVATGGGILEQPANERLLRQTTVIWLTARPGVLVGRLAGHRDRPLLRSDPLAALEAQAARRTAAFAAVADWIIATDRLDPPETASEIVRFVTRRSGRGADGLVVRTPGAEYEVVVAAGALSQLPTRLSDRGRHGRIWVVSDEQVWGLHGSTLGSILEGAAIDFRHTVVPAGESFKNLTVATSLYDWLLGGRVERGDTLLAFGGGVVGDLAGFVAATVLRGIGLIQLPTTILAMVDSSIGGKTGVDHAVGKNLIGSFYQPELVLSDTSLLQTLPLADRQAGWSEAIKHGVIADAALFDDLGEAAESLRRAEEPLVSEMIRRAAAVKVAVVGGDEREHGARILLNYGHTIGHALEQWSEYTLRHGEGVAIGMCVAACIARRLGLFSSQGERRQHATLRAFDLPVMVPAEVEPARLLEITRGDKKVRGQKVRWVLPTAIGSATVRSDVDDATVLAALSELKQQ